MFASCKRVNYFIIFIFIVSFLRIVVSVPQIFTDSYSFCSFKFNLSKKNVIQLFPNKLYTIDRRDIEFTIYFSLCENLQDKCMNKSSSCLIYKNSQQVINLGHTFVPDDMDNLVSINGDRCLSDPSKNYTLHLSLECSDSIKTKPILGYSDEEDGCTFQARMMRPNCRPKCTEIIENSYLLDIRNFRNTIQVQSDSKQFSLSLCGSNRDCSSDISACEILQNQVIPLARIESQLLNYDVGKNELTARGRYKDHGVLRDVQVLIKCNWLIEVGAAKHKKVQIQGRHYRFEVESSYGCVKLPQKCAFLSIDGLNYNLTDLYGVDGWEVAGVPNGRIVMNICGPLSQMNGSLCSDQHSQVCHMDNNNYVNRGSILTSLAAHDDLIKAIFVSGSTCEENTQLLYSTEIEFRCSKLEKGPIFKEFRGCVMYIVWETPRACPVDYYRSQNCYMNDRVSNRNLQKLYDSQKDKTYPLSSNNSTRLVYNLCGPLHSTCHNFSNVSFCLRTEENEDVVIAWDTRELISDNGLLRMELKGATCSNRRSKGEINVNFVCNYENPSPPSEMTVVEDGCRFNLTVFTSLACLSQNPFYDCIYSTENLTYNLYPLVRKTDNYVIHLGQNLDYVFNLCGPIISGPGALCRGDTMFCLHNKTELSVKHRYISLGGVARPQFINNSLVVEAKMGSFCEGLGYYRSVIQFECAESQMSPMFLSQDKCTYNFLWKTPEACPQEKACTVPSQKLDLTLDLIRLHNKIIDINLPNGTNKYKFYVCKDLYTRTSNGHEKRYKLKREYFNINNTPYLVLDLEKNCNNSISKVIFKLECSMEESFNQTSFENCIVNVTIRTSLACPLVKDNLEYSLVTSEKSVPKVQIRTFSPQIKKNCSIINGKTGYEFHLNKIKSEKILFQNSDFVVNIGDDSTNCEATLCRNDQETVGKMCPVTSFNYTYKSVNLLYSTTNKCSSTDFYKLEVVLKCNETRTGAKFLQNENCKSSLAYNLPEACDLLKEDLLSDSSTPTAAITGSISAIALVLGAILLIYLNRGRCRRNYMPFHRDKCTVPIYCRNSTE